MVTPAQVKRFLAPLRERHPEFIYHHRTIYSRVGGHLVWGVHLDGTSVPGCLCPTRIVHCLVSQGCLGQTWVPQMIRRDQSKSVMYQWLDPDSHVEFAEAYDLEAIPVLETVQTLADYASHSRSPGVYVHAPGIVTARYPLNIALGRFDWVREATPIVESGAAIATMTVHPRNQKLRSFFKRVAEFVPMVHADDRKAMVALLHELVHEEVRNLKLEAWWKPEPFPLEAML